MNKCKNILQTQIFSQIVKMLRIQIVSFFFSIFLNFSFTVGIPASTRNSDLKNISEDKGFLCLLVFSHYCD